MSIIITHPWTREPWGWSHVLSATMGLENLKRRLYNKISPQRKYQLEKENRPIQNAVENAFTLGLYCPRPPRPAPPPPPAAEAARPAQTPSAASCSASARSSSACARRATS